MDIVSIAGTTIPLGGWPKVVCSGDGCSNAAGFLRGGGGVTDAMDTAAETCCLKWRSVLQEMRRVLLLWKMGG